MTLVVSGQFDLWSAISLTLVVSGHSPWTVARSPPLSLCQFPLVSVPSRAGAQDVVRPVTVGIPFVTFLAGGGNGFHGYFHADVLAKFV